MILLLLLRVFHVKHDPDETLRGSRTVRRVNRRLFHVKHTFDLHRGRKDFHIVRAQSLHGKPTFQVLHSFSTGLLGFCTDCGIAIRALRR